MAVLYSVLDLLLNLQHCFYNFYRKPKQKRKQQQQETSRAAALAQQQGSNNNNPSNEQTEKLQQLPSTETASLQRASIDNLGNSASNAATAEDMMISSSSSFSVAPKLAAIPAAHHLRALSAGKCPQHCFFPFHYSKSTGSQMWLMRLCMMPCQSVARLNP